MGVLTPGSAHAGPSAQPPIDTSGNFLVTGPSGDLSVEKSPLGAGGRPKAELHRPPPLPWAGRGRDQRHRARTGPTQTDVSWFDLLIYISASSSPEIARLLVIEFTVRSHA